MTEHNKTEFSKPIEIMIADALFIRINRGKNHFQITDLREKYAHYSIWFYGSIIDLHKTLEPHNNLPKTQIPILKRKCDWTTFGERFAQEVVPYRNSLFQIAKVNDSKWQDLEIEYIPNQILKELLPTIVKGHRYNFSMDLLNDFGKIFHYAKLKELADCPVVLGKSPEGYFVVSDGTNCVICDGDRFSKIIEKIIEQSFDSS